MQSHAHRTTTMGAVLLLLAALLLAVPVGPADAQGPDDGDSLQLTSPTNPDEATAVSIELSSITVADGAGVPVLIGRNDVFADSLASAAGQASATENGFQIDTANAPLLLVPSNAAIPQAVMDEIARIGAPNAFVLGGTAAVPESSVDQLRAAGVTVERLSGAGRNETAVAIAERFFPQARIVVIARAGGPADNPTAGFADSIAAGGFAAGLGAPIVLTNTDTLPDVTRQYLVDLAPSLVYVAGGPAAVSDAVFAELVALRPGSDDTIRIAGASRTQTAVEFAVARGYSGAGSASGVIVVDGFAEFGWASGFAAALRSGQSRAPIVLVGANGPDADTQAWLDNTRPDDTGVTYAQGTTPPTLTCSQVTSICTQVATTIGASTPTTIGQAPSGPQVTTNGMSPTTGPGTCLNNLAVNADAEAGTLDGYETHGFQVRNQTYNGNFSHRDPEYQRGQFFIRLDTPDSTNGPAEQASRISQTLALPQALESAVDLDQMDFVFTAVGGIGELFGGQTDAFAEASVTFLSPAGATLGTGRFGGFPVRVTDSNGFVQYGADMERKGQSGRVPAGTRFASISFSIQEFSASFGALLAIDNVCLDIREREVAIGSVLGPGDSIEPGEKLRSPNADHQLLLRRSGDLVFISGGTETVLAGGAGFTSATMRPDGNFVLEQTSGQGGPASGTSSTSASLEITDNGSIVVRSIQGQPIATLNGGLTATAGPVAVRSQLLPGEQLGITGRLTSPNGLFAAEVRASGALVVIDTTNGAVRYDSGTGGSGVRLLEFRTDGNLVLEDASGGGPWSTGTTGGFPSPGNGPGGVVEMQDDGNLTVRETAGGTFLWGSANGDPNAGPVGP